MSTAELYVYVLTAAGRTASALQLPLVVGQCAPPDARPEPEMEDVGRVRRWPADVDAAPTTLCLAYKDLREVSNCVADEHGSRVKYLDLSHNQLSSLQFLVRFDRLATLVLDHNRLTSGSIPPPLPHLDTVWVNHNNITDLAPFLRALRYNCPNISHLSMIGNPAVPSLVAGNSRGDYYRYRLRVLAYFPRLLSLDQQRVELWERPDSDTLWAKVTSPDSWREIQRKVSVGATGVAEAVTDTVGQGFDMVASWWDSRRAEADERRSRPRNVLV